MPESNGVKRPRSPDMDLTEKLLAAENLDLLAKAIHAPQGHAIRLLPTEQITELQEFQPDLLIEYETSSGKCVLHIEFQTSRNGLDIVRRSLVYDALAFSRYKMPVYTWILWDARTTPAEDRLSMGWWSYVVQNVWLHQWNAFELFATMRGKIKAGIPLKEEEKALFALSPMLDHEGAELGEIATQAVEIAESLPENEERRLLYLLSGLADHYLSEADKKILEQAVSHTMIIEDFIQRGKQEGELEAKREIARNMLRDGEPVEKVIRYTGLSQEEVEHLAEEVQIEAEGS